MSDSHYEAGWYGVMGPFAYEKVRLDGPYDFNEETGWLSANVTNILMAACR